MRLAEQVRQTRRKLTAAKKRRTVVLRQRRLVCAPGNRLVSVSSTGVPGNGESADPQVSADDRYVVFSSDATNLVPGDTNRATDLFVHDRLKRTTTRVSVRNDGRQVARGGSSPAISADGRYVAFVSNSPDLGVPAPDSVLDQTAGIFVRDLVAGTTTRASYAADGRSHLNHWPRDLSISDDGRWIAFDSFASNVVPGYRPTEMVSAYVVDRVGRKNYHASVTSTGAPTNGWVWDVQISGNGRFVVYSTDASNYIPGRGQKWDHKIFMAPAGSYTRKLVDRAHGATLAPDATFLAYRVGSDGIIEDVRTGKELRVTGLGGKPPVDGGLAHFSLSDGGRVLAFSSESTNIVKQTTRARTEQVYVRVR